MRSAVLGICSSTCLWILAHGPRVSSSALRCAKDPYSPTVARRRPPVAEQQRRNGEGEAARASSNNEALSAHAARGTPSGTLLRHDMRCTTLQNATSTCQCQCQCCQCVMLFTSAACGVSGRQHRSYNADTDGNALKANPRLAGGLARARPRPTINRQRRQAPPMLVA